MLKYWPHRSLLSSSFIKTSPVALLTLRIWHNLCPCLIGPLQLQFGRSLAVLQQFPVEYWTASVSRLSIACSLLLFYYNLAFRESLAMYIIGPMCLFLGSLTQSISIYSPKYGWGKTLSNRASILLLHLTCLLFLYQPLLPLYISSL